MASRKASDRFIIGLTGNIGTGKSLVRRMLQALGAFGIDGDDLAFQAARKDSRGYYEIVAAFGADVLAADGAVDRQKLGRIVFDSPELLTRLERIIHPIVLAEVDRLIEENPSAVYVIEAIKLLESDLVHSLDSIWVTTSSPETQFSRLTGSRGMSPDLAKQRIDVQNDPAVKVKAAHVVLVNDGSVEDLWRQVARGWNAVLSKHIEQGLVFPAPDRMPGELLATGSGKKVLS